MCVTALLIGDMTIVNIQYDVYPPTPSKNLKKQSSTSPLPSPEILLGRRKIACFDICRRKAKDRRIKKEKNLTTEPRRLIDFCGPLSYKSMAMTPSRYDNTSNALVGLCSQLTIVDSSVLPLLRTCEAPHDWPPSKGKKVGQVMPALAIVLVIIMAVVVLAIVATLLVERGERRRLAGGRRAVGRWRFGDWVKGDVTWSMGAFLAGRRGDHR
ncbi:hypothetical protein BU24DRAFT_409454 [Aaosphaeria arxii CBS 175.79]|uniref:Uncharacterized protein n=1 Tax=Aaosphaeria arxii CBS 175.79 TaxID=1450172 RepID=A0A6A5XVR1_9PLEO|nr:uncharacterized protein BU24DRAFT_409454 [Aaosphaeria arxii CBS 175.79]KAF2016344.1 hypothetical protein BU24DRAFT_409454 [Aaosphaeria arxii CBS 175.79]